MANKLKLRVAARFLASFFNGVGTKVRVDGLARYLDLDYTQFTELTSGLDPADSLVAIYNKATAVWNVTTLGTILNASQTVQIIGATGVVNVAATDGLIILNGAAPYTVNLPASASKVGKVKIVDWKGDVNTTNPVTVNANGSEEFNGGGSSWLIEAGGASAVFDPIPTLGYAV